MCALSLPKLIEVTDHGTGTLQHNWFDGSQTSLGEYALGIYSGLWAYNGMCSHDFISDIRMG